jgi:hypothetical protein
MNQPAAGLEKGDGMATTTEAPPEQARLSIHGVAQDSLRIFGRNFLLFFGIVLVLRALWLLAAVPVTPGHLLTWADWPGQIVNPLLRLALAGIAQALFAFGTLRTLQGGRALAGDLTRGLRAPVSLILVTLICFIPQALAFLAVAALPEKSMIGALLGMIVFLVNLAVLTLWWLAIPVIAVERLGAFAALARCWRLVLARRWRVFGVVAVVALLLMGGSALATLVLGLNAMEVARPMPTSIGSAIWFLVDVLLSGYLAILAIVTYARLRGESEGALPPLG